MAKTLIKARQLMKRGTGVPLVAPSNDHTDGSWNELSIYAGEIFLGVEDNAVYTRNPVTDEIVRLFAGETWTLFAASFYTAAPASTTTVTLLSDQTAKLQVGDVVKVKLTGITAPVFCFIEAVTSSLLTVSGVPLSATIEFMWYCLDNKSRIQTLIIPIRNEEDIWALGEARPAVSATPGATPAAPSNLYGENIFWAEKIELPFGSYLVRAKIAAANCGSSATAAEIEIGFSGQAAAATVSIDTQENYAATIDKATYQVAAPAILDGVNVISAGGNKDASDLCVHLWFFINAKI